MTTEEDEFKRAKAAALQGYDIDKNIYNAPAALREQHIAGHSAGLKEKEKPTN